MVKRKKIILVLLGLAAVGTAAGFWIWKGSPGGVSDQPMVNTKTREEIKEEWENAEHTPYGKYPEEVTYTLGKISGANNANLPVGETYENNGYTRYLKEILNIQNKDIFEMEDGEQYDETVRLAIKDRDIPDIMVVKGRDNLKELIKYDLVEDITDVYEECASDRVKEMYESYGEGLLQSATYDGKLYALPDTVIDHGAMMLWMRKDWIDQLGLEEPQTMEEAMDIIQKFVEADVAGDNETIGLACNTSMVSKSSSTYSVDPIFTMFHTAPQSWILDEKGNVTYGSLTQETKSALAYMNYLYQTGILDPKFLLRTPENINDLIDEGQCGAFFGSWWAPNNPLMSSYSADPQAEWQPYFLTSEDENKVQTFESYSDWQYVVVRKGYKHPEIVPKYISVMFDYSRYQDKKAEEINEYFALNVDPTARPMNINVDYRDALYRTTRNIRDALEGDYPIESLSGLEYSYFNTCKSYLNGNLTTANAWAAYASRITAVGLLVDSGFESNIPLSLGEVDGEVSSNLLKLEKQAFLQIVSGEKPVAYFDTFVSEWYSQGGKELTQKVRESYQNQE
ncbi:MAG TPA: extracellular solute-binding protein [Candidatus Pelethocola excrementipullorum]|nr:extracellular solute-binding protein [Candidatus Pelethocola excrementipullorum]